MSVGKIIRRGLSFSNVVASGIATAQIPHGRTIEGLHLVLGGTTFNYSHITLIRLRANGKVFWECTGSQADRLAKYQGLNYPVALLPIHFTELRGRDLVDQMLGAFDTSSGIANLTIEVTITGATAPTLEYYLLESGPQAEQVSAVMSKVLRYPWSMASAGRLPVALPFGPVSGSVIRRIHVEHGVANNVQAVEVKENGVVVHESLRAVNEGHNQAYFKVNQANVYTVDFMPDWNVKNAMDTRTDRTLELLLTLGAADSGTVLVEYLDTLGNL